MYIVGLDFAVDTNREYNLLNSVSLLPICMV